MVAYRERWAAVRCEGLEMGWLSAQHAPGFVGWGEKRVKDHLVKIGLSSALESPDRHARARRRRRAGESASEEKGPLEVDVQSLFSIRYAPALFASARRRDESSRADSSRTLVLTTRS